MMDGVAVISSVREKCSKQSKEWNINGEDGM